VDQAIYLPDKTYATALMLGMALGRAKAIR
jgi:hypothetical protein